jgi:tetratricopeptide (TPR) repeat protein
VFYLAALLCWLRFSGVGPGSGSADGEGRSRGRGLAYAGALVFFLCGLLSKTAVLTLPAALLVIGWWKRGRLGRADVISVVPMFAIGTVFGVVTLWLERQHVGAAGPEWDLGLAERIIVAGRAVWFYATQLVLPFRLNFIYPRWAVDATAVWQWVYPLAALALPVLLWRRRARLGRGPLAGVLFYGITLAPALGLLGFYFQLYSFVQDHHQYLASAGLIGLITGVAAAGLRRWHARAAVAAAALVVCVLGALTWVRSGHFTSEAALWESVLARNPGAWMAEINLGLVRQREGKLVEAEERFRRALAIEHPEHAKAHTNLGAVLEARGDFEGAGEQYAAALEKDPDYPEAHFNLGSLLAGGDREDQAIAHFRAAVEAEPRFVQARYALALLLAERGGEFEAERHLREAIRLNPGYVDAVDALARILGPQGRREEAVELYRRVLLFDPTRAEVHYNLGFNLEQLEDLEGAERHYRAAIELQPDLAGAHNNLAIVLYRTGRYAEAWQEVIRYRELGGRPHRDFLRALADAMPPPE